MDDQRDYEDERATRAALEREGRQELEAEVLATDPACGHSLDRIENDEVTADEHARQCERVATTHDCDPAGPCYC